MKEFGIKLEGVRDWGRRQSGEAPLGGRKRLWGLGGREKDRRKEKRLEKGSCGLCHVPAHCPVSRGATVGL